MIVKPQWLPPEGLTTRGSVFQSHRTAHRLTRHDILTDLDSSPDGQFYPVTLEFPEYRFNVIGDAIDDDLVVAALPIERTIVARGTIRFAVSGRFSTSRIPV